MKLCYHDMMQLHRWVLQRVSLKNVTFQACSVLLYFLLNIVQASSPGPDLGERSNIIRTLYSLKCSA